VIETINDTVSASQKPGRIRATVETPNITAEMKTVVMKRLSLT
jgi:hypothetical protein